MPKVTDRIPRFDDALVWLFGGAVLLGIAAIVVVTIARLIDPAN